MKITHHQLQCQRGQSLVEYLIIVALVGVGAISIMRSVGQNVNVQFAKVAKALGGDVQGSPKASPITESMYNRRDLKNFMGGALGNKSKSETSETTDDSSGKD